MALTPGTRLGVYEVTAHIGEGGMGQVYRARDTKLNRDVALKLLSDSFANDAERLARFTREAQTLASLNHPNIAHLYGLEGREGQDGREGGTGPFLVMELVEGDDLSRRIARSAISLGEALRIARQIAEALEAAHEAGIIHRDLKPANIKVRPDGTVKVLDFGLAKLAQASDSGLQASGELSHSPTITTPAMTRAGVILGTAAYMSPEQARGHPVDKRTDIWAFGCVVHELLTGRAAFARETVTDTLAAVVDQEPDWHGLPPDTPPIVVRLLRRCLEKDPKRRLHDIADARLEIEEALDRPAVASPAPVALPRSRAGERIAWAIGVGILALFASWLLYSNRLSREPAVVALSVLPAGGTTFHQEGAYPSVSPDGRHLVFVVLASGGQQQLWIRRVDSTVLRPLEGTDGATRPFWSPDSRSVAFFANGQLRRIDVDTGSTRVVCDAPYRGGMAGTWGDGIIVVAGLPGGLGRVPASGGQLTTIVVERLEDGDPITPSFLPDGRHFVYGLTRAQPEQSQICVASVDSAGTSCLLNAHSSVRYAAPGYLLFVRNGALHAQPFDPRRLEVSGEAFRIGDAQVEGGNVYNPPLFSASDNGILAYHSRGTASLVWLDRSGRPMGPSLGAGGRPALSPDETRIVVVRRDPQTGGDDLWLRDVSSGIESRFTFHPSEDGWPAFSPDGERVVFSSNRTGRGQLYQKRASGDGVEELIAPAAVGNDPDWSSDGRFVIYQTPGAKTGFDLWAVPLSGDRKPFPIAQTEHGEREGRFSPDVRWVAYDSTESGRREVWIQPFPPTGSRWQISTTGGVSPQWRRDGKELFFVAADGSMTAVAIDAGTTLKWDAPQPLFQTMYRGGTYASYAVSRDGQRFLTSVPPSLEDTLPITIVMNWTSLLQR